MALLTGWQRERQRRAAHSSRAALWLSSAVVVLGLVGAFLLMRPSLIASGRLPGWLPGSPEASVQEANSPAAKKEGSGTKPAPSATRSESNEPPGSDWDASQRDELLAELRERSRASEAEAPAAGAPGEAQAQGMEIGRAQSPSTAPPGSDALGGGGASSDPSMLSRPSEDVREASRIDPGLVTADRSANGAFGTLEPSDVVESPPGSSTESESGPPESPPARGSATAQSTSGPGPTGKQSTSAPGSTVSQATSGPTAAQPTSGPGATAAQPTSAPGSTGEESTAASNAERSGAPRGSAQPNPPGGSNPVHSNVETVPDGSIRINPVDRIAEAGATEEVPGAANRPSAEADEAGLETVAAEPIGTPPAIAPDAAFVVHLGSFRLRREADAEVARLAGLGYDARALHVNVPGKGPWYRVVVGAFATFAEARENALVLAKSTGRERPNVVGAGGYGAPVPVLEESESPGKATP